MPFARCWIVALVGVNLAAGCRAQASYDAAAPASSARAPVAIESAPGEPAPPPEPSALAVVSRPGQSVCELNGPLAEAVDLGGHAGGEPLTRLAAGNAMLLFGADGAAFAEVRLPSATVLRGFASAPGGKTAPPVYARRWLAFGGVDYVAAGTPLWITGASDGKLVVAASSGTPQFALDGIGRVLEVSCADLGLVPDADGELGKRVPPAFEASGREQFMWLRGKKPVPIAAVADGPAGGALTPLEGQPLEVVVLERRGRLARVRYQHVAGWVDAAVLSAKAPKRANLEQPAPADVSSSAAPQQPPGADPKSTRRMVCDAEVRLVAELGSSRFVVGAIPAQQAFVVSELSAELWYLALEGTVVSPGRGARLAVPGRDVAACSDAKEGVADAFGEWHRTTRRLQVPDAISLLPASPPPRAPTGKKEEEFGMIGLIQPTDPDFGEIGLSGIGPPASKGNKAPKVRLGPASVTGRLPTEVVQRIVRQNLGRVRLCYDQGLNRNPKLAGRVSARFQIEADGSVSKVSSGGSDIPDSAVVSCVLSTFYGTSFPQPKGGGTVTAVMSMLLTPN